MSEQDDAGTSAPSDGGHTPGGSPATGGTGVAAAGTPNGRSPSGATSAGSGTDDTGAPEHPPVQADATSGAPVARHVPGQLPGAAVPPVPSPGDVPGASLPNVAVGEAPSPETGIHAGEKSEGSDATTASPGSFVALAPPGHPDGEVDTRTR